jgi:hypothetical protein
MRRFIAILGLGSVAFSASAASFMNVANGVWSTGFNNSAVILGSGAVDPHYTLIKLPAGCAGNLSCSEDGTLGNAFGPGTYVVMGPNGTYPLNGAWLANDSNSLWLGPRADQRTPFVGGITWPNVEIFGHNTDFYVYRMVFNLTLLGLNPASAVINLSWLSDNNNGVPNTNASHIRLCGIASASDTNPCASGTAITNSGNAGQGAPALTNVIIAHGSNNATFVDGYMALDFVVYNEFLASGFNPSGLRVQINSAIADVPEPATLALMAAGLMGLGLMRRKS